MNRKQKAQEVSQNSMKAKKKDLSHLPDKIIGRLAEQILLKELIESKRAEFIAIYGRRRVGKTYLIKNFTEPMSDVFFHVTGLQNGKLKQQLEEFSKQIGNAFYQGAPIKPRTNWIEAFEDLNNALMRVPKGKKIVIFLDEFPWMATPRSNLLTALELYWNRYWVFDERIKLIICGSATSWIIEKIINNRGGLHNRITRTINLKPFSLNETETFLHSNKIRLTKRQILELYFVLGGVPLYWSYIRKGLSASQNIDELCFQKDGQLAKEFERLFQSLFEDAKPYVDIIRAIAKHRYGIGQAELISKLKLSEGGSTTRKLHQLEEAGFISSFVPYGHRDKGVYYLVDDEYSLFYLYWIEPNIKGTSKGYWVSQSTKPAWKSWSGLAFESICYKHIGQIQKALDIDPGATAHTWRFSPRKDQDGVQIDLLFDRSDNAITICEIKNSDDPFAIDKAYYQRLMKKIEVFKKQTRTKKQLFFSMITSSGLAKTIYSEELVSSHVELGDLFEAV